MFSSIKKRMAVGDSFWWEVPYWIPASPKEEPPALLLGLADERNARFVTANLSDRLPPVKAPPGKPSEKALAALQKRRDRRMRRLIACGVVLDWKNVTDDAGQPVAFPDVDPRDPDSPGAKMVLEFLDALGLDVWARLLFALNSPANYQTRVVEVDEVEEDDEDGDPLDESSPAT